MKRLVLLLFLCACPKPVPDPPLPGAATCADFCKRMTTLGCPEAEPTPEGASCEDVCTNIEESGVLDWDLDCRVRATSCAAVDACEL